MYHPPLPGTGPQAVQPVQPFVAHTPVGNPAVSNQPVTHPPVTHPLHPVVQHPAPIHAAPRPGAADQDRLPPTFGHLTPAGTPAPVPALPQHLTPPSPNVIALQTLSNTVESADMRAQESIRNIALYDVEIQKKFAIAFACIIFVFLGAPIALRFPRGGVGMVLGVSLGVFAIYYIGLIAGEPLGDRGTLTPFLAMWSSNIVFSIIGAVLMANVSRGGQTSRGGDWGEIRDGIVRRYRLLLGSAASQGDSPVTSAEGA